MSQAQYVKYFKFLEEQLMNLGYGKAKAKLISQDDNGNIIAWMNMTATGSASGDQQVFARFHAWPADFPDNMKTQLHAFGEFSQSNALVELIMQSTDDAAISADEAAHHKFRSDVIHAFRGQLGAVVQLKLTVHGTNPGASLLSSGALVKTVATWDAAGTLIGKLQPYGRSVPGAGSL